jgi:hypothetical protein
MPLPSGVSTTPQPSSNPTPPVSVTGATTGGSSGIAGGRLPNPNLPTSDRLQPETLRELARRSGGR